MASCNKKRTVVKPNPHGMKKTVCLSESVIILLSGYTGKAGQDEQAEEKDLPEWAGDLN